MINRAIVCFALFASSAFAQGFTLDGLTSGLVFDPAQRALRPFLGIPGSGYLGGARLSGLDQAWPAPDARAAVVVHDGQVFLVRGLGDSEPAWLPIDEAGSTVIAAWSAASSAVAVYSQTGLRLLQVQGGEPGIHWPETAGEERVSALAVARDARSVFFVRESGQSTGVYIASAAAGTRLVAPLGGSSYLALANGDRDLIAVGWSGGEARIIRDAAGAAESASLPLDAGEEAEIVGAACSADGKRLFVAARRPARVLVLNLGDGAMERVLEVDSPPSRLELLSGGSLYALNAPGNGDPLLVLDAGFEPRVYFVPTGGPAAQEEN
ncbi:MAG: hypothetical protein IT158_27790 [Bryobacterales bacterium]|nr:hypothetical protein [Bryobacterales bacterium]